MYSQHHPKLFQSLFPFFLDLFFLRRLLHPEIVAAAAATNDVAAAAAETQLAWVNALFSTGLSRVRFPTG